MTASPKPTEQQIFLGRYLRTIWGKQVRVIRYHDDDRTHAVDLLIADDCPDQRITSYATLGFSTLAQHWEGKEVRIELVSACASDIKDFDRLLPSCVFDCMRNGTNIVYGAVIEALLDQYALSSTLRHVVFLSPFLWENVVAKQFMGMNVHWLFMLPITDGELEYLKAHGIDALEKHLQEHPIDVCDIQRACSLEK